MSTYSEALLKSKFDKLENTVPSITGLSQWILYHRKRHTESIDLWNREFLSAPPEKKIVFLYLANDVLQESRRKGDEFLKDFEVILEEVIKHLYMYCPAEDIEKVNRLLNVWETRNVFRPELLRALAAKAKSQDGAKGKVSSQERLRSPSPSRPSYDSEFKRPEDLGELGNKSFEEVLGELSTLLNEFNESEKQKLELEKTVRVISATSAEKLDKIKSQETYDLQALSTQLEEESLAVQQFEFIIKRRVKNAKRTRALYQAFNIHLAEELRKDAAWSNECESLRGTNQFLQEKVQEKLDNCDIVLKHTDFPLGSQAISAKRDNPYAKTSLSDYKKQKTENPNGNPVNNILG